MVDADGKLEVLVEGRFTPRINFTYYMGKESNLLTAQLKTAKRNSSQIENLTVEMVLNFYCTEVIK